MDEHHVRGVPFATTCVGVEGQTAEVFLVVHCDKLQSGGSDGEPNVFRERHQIRICTCKKRNARFQQVSFLDRDRAHQRCGLLQPFRKCVQHLGNREGGR